jgi:hypothetical protein
LKPLGVNFLAPLAARASFDGLSNSLEEPRHSRQTLVELPLCGGRESTSGAAVATRGPRSSPLSGRALTGRVRTWAAFGRKQQGPARSDRSQSTSRRGVVRRPRRGRRRPARSDLGEGARAVRDEALPKVVAKQASAGGGPARKAQAAQQPGRSRADEPVR